MATFELYRRSTIGMCLTETLDEMVNNGTLSPELAIQVLIQFDKVEMPVPLPPRLFLCRCMVFQRQIWSLIFAPLCCSSSP
jgi:hypothetical protein